MSLNSNSPRHGYCSFRWIAAALLLAAAGQAVRATGKEPPPAGKTKTGEKKGKEQKFPPFPTGPREKQFVDELGSEYKLRHTDHFFVMYNTGEPILKEFIARIEATYASVHRFAVGCGIKIEYPKEKLPVVFCDQFEQYSDVAKRIGGSPAPKEAAGLYFPGANFSLFYDMSHGDHVKDETARANKLKEEARSGGSPVERRNKSKEAQFILNRLDNYQQHSNKSTVQHEVAHQLLHNFQVHRRDGLNPVWFVEGMATLFEPPPSANGAGYNITNQYRLWRLREADSGKSIPDLAEMIKNPMTLRGGADQMDKGYATAWGLTFYLAQKQKKQMVQYIELIKQRKSKSSVTPEQEVKDFEKCFGPIDDAFKKKWNEFLRKLPYRPPR